MTQFTYPGVYIQEVPSGARSIVGVSTGVTAFIGAAKSGPLNTPVRVFNFGDFERQFGGLSLDSDLSYAVLQFFQNGGSEAIIVRVANGAEAAAITLQNSVGGTDVLTIEAASEGVIGNTYRVAVDYDTSVPESTFNLTVSTVDVSATGTTVERTEVYRNLSMLSTNPRYVGSVLNADSELIRVSVDTVAVDAAVAAAQATSVSGISTANISAGQNRVVVQIDGGTAVELVLADSVDADGVASSIETAINAEFGAGTVSAAAVGNAFPITVTRDTAGLGRSIRIESAPTDDAAAILRLGTANGGRETVPEGAARPFVSGTFAVTNTIDFANLPDDGTIQYQFAIGASTTTAANLVLWNASSKPGDVAELRARVLAAFAASGDANLQGASVSIYGQSMQVVLPEIDTPNRRIVFSGAVATDLGLDVAGNNNVLTAALGVGLTDDAAQSSPVVGADGAAPTPGDFIGSQASKTGIYALENVRIFNILTIPNVSELAVQQAAINYCNERRAFFIGEIPADRTTVADVESWITGEGANLRDKNAALYFPRIVAQDPLQEFRTRPFSNVGLMAGVYARIDSNRGVWKAPAGIEADLRSITGLTAELTDPENGVINPLGVNALRTFPVAGSVAWGARTTDGADALASEWKYVSVRRLVLFIEESVYQGTQFAVFEPNNESLWAQLRAVLGGFLQDLFREGAFQGTSPREAYFVKVDSETTTQTDINNGIVNILVGIAPVRPAEFVVIRIQQIAGESAT